MSSGRGWNRCCRPTRSGRPSRVDETAAHRRDQVAGAGRCALAGRPGLLRLLAGGVCAVPAVAAGPAAWANRSSPPCNPGGRGRTDHLGRQRGLNDRPGAPARRRRPPTPPASGERRPVASSADRDRPRAADASPRRADHEDPTWLVEQAQKVLSLVVTAGQHQRLAPQFQAVLDGVMSPRHGRGRPPHTARQGPGRQGLQAPTQNRAYLRRRGIACTHPETADQTTTPERTARPPRRPPSPGSSPDATEPGTPSNAESTDSNATAPSPPDTTLVLSPGGGGAWWWRGRAAGWSGWRWLCPRGGCGLRWSTGAVG